MISCKNPKCTNPKSGTYHLKGKFNPTENKNEYRIRLMCLYCLASFSIKIIEVKEEG